MSCECNNHLILEINQGAPRNYGFTINQNIYTIVDNQEQIVQNPVDLTNTKVIFQVKEAPYYKLKPLIEKIITNEEQVGVGVITSPTDGKFTVAITLDDTLLLPPKDYALCIYLDTNGSFTNISGEGNKYAIFRVCTQ